MRGVLGVTLVLATLLAGCFADEPAPPPPAEPPAPAPPPPPPLVTVAHVDAGINPYHVMWRTDAPFAMDHPSTYIPGYPAAAVALDLTLGNAPVDQLYAADKAKWEATQPGQLYYVPGTRIVGLIDLFVNLTAPTDGHGMMTASRAVGPDSLAPTARFVAVKGLGFSGFEWVRDQAWIDVFSYSVSDLRQVPGIVPIVQQAPHILAEAATRIPVLIAAPNGAAHEGAGPWPSYLSQSAPAGVLQVGMHDNGNIVPNQGQPVHIVADGFGGPHADHQSTTEMGPPERACCNGAAAPYAAGAMAALLLEARIMFNDTSARSNATDQSVLAVAGLNATVPATGPLSDGMLTLDELKSVFLHTAQNPVLEGPHDGEVGAPGSNTYCTGCFAVPLSWSQIPAGVPVFQHVGYGAIDPTSLALGIEVLRGAVELPTRDAEDQFFAVDDQVRAALNP